MMVNCETCSCKIDETNRVDIDGDIVCRDCYHDNYATCENCAEVVNIDDAYSYNGEYYCEDCYTNRFSKCFICSDVYPIDNLIGSEITGENYCENCYNDIFSNCEGCECEYFNEDVFFSENNGCSYCESCYPSCNSDNVFNYDYKPEFTYYRSGNETKNSETVKNLYYGIELEVENKDDASVEDIVDNLPNFVYAKGDSSLDNGFEIVSHPATYQWLKENADRWLSILNISKQGFRSYNTNTCGIHIHLSKNYFSSLHLYKFLTLFYKQENAKFILRISQRVKSSFDQWATLHEALNDKNLVYKAKNKQGNYNRYAAINLLNLHTIEIRIFKGTLNPRSFWKNIEFLQAVIDFTKDTTLKEIDESHFLMYVYNHKKEYVNLHNWLWNKKFYADSLSECMTEKQ